MLRKCREKFLKKQLQEGAKRICAVQPEGVANSTKEGWEIEEEKAGLSGEKTQ